MSSASVDKVILEKAVQLLAQRNHTEFELKQKLLLFFSKKRSKNVPHQNNASFTVSPQLSSLAELKEHITQVVCYCQQKKWINETLFVSDYIAMRQRRGFGKMRIELELKQRGVDNELIASAFSHLEPQDVTTTMKNLVQKKYGMINSADIKQRQKIYRFLLSRGFSQQNVNNIYSLFED